MRTNGNQGDGEGSDGVGDLFEAGMGLIAQGVEVLGPWTPIHVMMDFLSGNVEELLPDVGCQRERARVLVTALSVLSALRSRGASFGPNAVPNVRLDTMH